MALLGVGSCELAFSETPENLVHLAHQVFSPMAFLGVGSCVLAPGSFHVLAIVNSAAMNIGIHVFFSFDFLRVYA